MQIKITIMKLAYRTLMLIILIASSHLASGQINKKGTDRFKVVVNHEEQYSIWPAGQELSKEWTDTGVRGNLKMCRDHIEEVWTDMRPLSIQKMDLDANTRYKVVINHEEQYSIWPVKLKEPKGWKPTKMTGNLSDCMKYIEEVWTDMRPLSLRRR
jgi:MbtH protein